MKRNIKSGEVPPVSPESDTSPLMAYEGFAGHRFDASKYSPEKAITFLDKLRQALPVDDIRVLPNKISELPNELRDPAKELFECLDVGQRITLKSIWTLLDEAAKALLKSLDLDHAIDIQSPDKYYGITPFFASLDQLFQFLREVSNVLRQIEYEIIAQTLKSAFEKACKTDIERKNLIQNILNDTGFSGFQVEIRPNVQEEEKSLPNIAPKLWLNRADKKQSPPDFIIKTYNSWINRGVVVSKPYLNRVDRPLYMALRHWLKRNIMPDGLILPTKAELLSDAKGKVSIDEARDAARRSRNAYNLLTR